jgi:hypothetical protein
MRKVPQSVDDILLDYLDGNLDRAELEKVEHSIRNNPDWQSRLEELRLVNSFLRETKIEQPSKNLTDAVMTHLHQYPAQKGFSIKNGILLLVVVLMAIGIATVLVSTGAFDNTSTSIDLNQMEVSKKFIKTPLPSFSFNGKLIVNIIIILNLALAWIVLDRTILKPFFQRRMQSGH